MTGWRDVRRMAGFPTWLPGLTAGGTATPPREARRPAWLRGASALAVVGLLAACEPAEERAQGHYQSGLALLEEEKPVKALLEFRNAISLDETHAGAHMEMGKLLQADNNLAAAINHYMRAIEVDETLLDAHLRMGQILLAADRLDEALRASNTAYQLAPENVDVLILKASLAIKLENYDSARESVATARAIDESDPSIWMLEAALARRAGDEAQALAFVRQGRAYDPDHMALALLEIDILARLDRQEELGAALAAVVEKNPKQMGLRQAQVRWMLSRSDFVGAEAAMREMAAMRPDEPERALDVVRFVSRVRGEEAGLEELDRLIAEAETPEDAYPFTSAKIGRMVTERRLAEAEALLRETIDTLEEGHRSRFDARLQLARLRLADGAREEAAEIVNDVLKADRRNSDGYALRGRLRLAQEEFESAVTDLRRSIKENPGNVEALMLLATAHRLNGNPSLSRERLGDAVESSDFAPRPALEYAQALANEGQLEVAEETLLQSVRRNPNDRQVLVALARVYLQRENWAAAEAVGQRLRRLDTGDLKGDQILSAALSGQERFDESIAILEAGNVLEEASGEAVAETFSAPRLNSLVAAKLRAGEVDGARALLERIVADESNNAEALRLLGVIAEREGDAEAAEARYRAAISAAPGNPAAYAALVKMKVRADDYRAAEDIAVEGVEAADSDELRLLLAGLFERRGELSQAIYQYRILFDRQPGSDVVANNLASILSDNDPTEADLERAAKIAKRLRNSDVPHFQDTYGWIAYLRGDLDSAYDALDKAARALPDNYVVQYHYGAVLAAVGETARAREVLQRVLELGSDSQLPQVERARTLLADLEKPDPETGSGTETAVQ